jgi:hypothetical protein
MKRRRVRLIKRSLSRKCTEGSLGLRRPGELPVRRNIHKRIPTHEGRIYIADFIERLGFARGELSRLITFAVGE